MRHIAQVDPSPLEDLHSTPLLNQVLHTLLGELNYSLLWGQGLVVRSRRAN